MKRYLLAALLILTFSNISYGEELQDSPVSNVSDVIFRSSLTDVIPEVNDSYQEYYYSFDSDRNYKEIDPNNMPFFKQMRLTVSNKILEAQVKRDSQEYVPVTQRIKNIWNKRKAGGQVENNDIVEPTNDLTSVLQSETSSEIPNEVLALEGGINEQVTEKQLILDSDNINFDDETGDMIATGRPILNLPPQNIKVIADKMIYNEESNILKGIGNDIVIKDGMVTKGDYLEVDMNEETVVMDNLDTLSTTMNLKAAKGIQKDGLLILHNGNFYSEESSIHRIQSRMIGPRFQNMLIDDADKSLFFGDPTGNKITIDIGSLYVEARKNHEVIKAKNIKVYRKDKFWFKWPSFTAYTNKDRDYFEANYPEFGTKRRLGMFIGPGFVFGGPGGSVIKAIPFLNYNHKFGFGGALKYLNTYNRTELGYGSANDLFFMKGIQRLDDNLFLQYAANTYMDEWFLGHRMPKYMAEVYFDKRYKNKDFLAPGMNLQFRHRAGFGIMEDNDRNFYGEKINSTGIATTRLRYMAELRQSFYSYVNEEKRIAFDLSMAMQGSAAVYGTGDTQFIARFGPRAHLQYKNWMQDIGYFIAGYSDETPVPRYDRYRYGHQSVYLTEAFRINKYLSVGWSGNINLSDDAPNGKMFQENRFLVAFGPDDLKITLGYDFVRQTTYFGFNVAFDSKGTTINYGKMEIKNPERLGKREKADERKLAFSAPKQQESSEVKVSSRRNKSAGQVKDLEYAQVIEIEDPDKETIQ